jgi:uncharacterized protein YndB with AHSA1/START domain
MSKIEIKNEVLIKASPERVWKILTDAAETKKYMFGCEPVSEWTPGSELLWRGEYEGKPMVFVKGKIVTIEPAKTLVYTVFDPNRTDMEDTEANYLRVEYALEKQGDDTLLKVTQGDYSTVARGEERYKEAANNGLGWQPILDLIRAQAESPVV